MSTFYHDTSGNHYNPVINVPIHNKKTDHLKRDEDAISNTNILTIEIFRKSNHVLDDILIIVPFAVWIPFILYDSSILRSCFPDLVRCQ